MLLLSAEAFNIPAVVEWLTYRRLFCFVCTLSYCVLVHKQPGWVSQARLGHLVSKLLVNVCVLCFYNFKEKAGTGGRPEQNAPYFCKNVKPGEMSRPLVRPGKMNRPLVRPGEIIRPLDRPGEMSRPLVRSGEMSRPLLGSWFTGNQAVPLMECKIIFNS